MIFSMNGRELPGLHIINYSVLLETLDGEGTGRSRARNWPMIRQPQGTITNLNLEFAASDSKEPDFVFVWRMCKSMGVDEFSVIKFVDPTGEIIEQNMYLVASELSYKRIERDGTVYSNSLVVNFIAEKGS